MTFSRPEKKSAACKTHTQPQGPSHLTGSSSSQNLALTREAMTSMPHVLHRNGFKKPVHGVSRFTISVEQNMLGHFQVLK